MKWLRKQRDMNYKDILQSEGFVHVYEWTDAPGEIYEAHAHKGKVSMYISKGSIEFCIENQCREYKEGDRIDVPIGVVHTATVGSEGCSFVVGEMIEGDS